MPPGAPQARLAAWGLDPMLRTAHPLREKLTLFWHNHFATSNAKVQNARFMLGQYRLMHRHALGSFKELLVEMGTDPAMMIWLDTIESTKGKPNENYARELMELFSLGIGNYTEADIKELARAMTGWRVENEQASFDKKQFDDGTKKLLGHTGNFDSESAVDVLLSQPAASRH